MSRPGYWRSGGLNGVEMPYSSMEDSHVKHALRYLRNKLTSLRAEGTNVSYINYCADKLVELGNEAQRRGMLASGDIPLDQLLTIIGDWQTAWDSRASRGITDPVRPVFRAIPQPGKRVDADSRLAGWSPQSTSGKIIIRSLLSMNVDVLQEISSVTGLCIITEEASQDYRRLDIEL